LASTQPCDACDGKSRQKTNLEFSRVREEGREEGREGREEERGQKRGEERGRVEEGKKVEERGRVISRTTIRPELGLSNTYHSVAEQQTN
jgi:hypothetical protein